MLVPLVVAGRLHVAPKRMVPTYATTLNIGIRKEGRMEVLESVHAAEAT
jgi:hypothetical protein